MGELEELRASAEMGVQARKTAARLAVENKALQAQLSAAEGAAEKARQDWGGMRDLATKLEKERDTLREELATVEKRAEALQTDNDHLRAIVGKCSEPGAPTYDEIVAESDKSHKRASEAEAKCAILSKEIQNHGWEITRPLPAAAQAVAEVLERVDLLCKLPNLENRCGPWADIWAVITSLQESKAKLDAARKERG